MFLMIMNLSFIMQVHYKNNRRPEAMLDKETDEEQGNHNTLGPVSI